MADARRAQLKDQTDISGARALIVEARFYDDIQDALLEGAVAELKAAGVTHDVITVPGALEIPAAISLAEASGDYDGFVALGVVIRGETYHFELVSNESGAGITRIGLDFGIPVANAVLTTENDEQAEARMAEKGTEAARCAVEMANLLLALEELQADED